jgi:hypothetical protein
MKVITQTQYKSELTITPQTPILNGVNVELRPMEEVWSIMEQETSQSEQDADNDLALVRRRAVLSTAFQALPTYGSADFWHLVEESQLKLTLPLEILVKCARVAIAQEDSTSRNRIIEMIFRRKQGANEHWSRQVLNRVHLTSEERCIFAYDLYADLCERVIRAMMDSKRLFWEENFQHCLCYERKHVYQAFMTREGRWYN